MSEYWVSNKKYYCKYCEIYIADDAPSRQHHENGLRHKGNRDRFVRGLYKQGEKRKKDLEEEKREIARVEQAANAAYARDVSSGLADTAASSSRIQKPAQPTISRKLEKPTSQFANYSTAQSLGYTDPDEDRLKGELERRKTQGEVGQWETVLPPPPPLPEGAESANEEPTPGTGEGPAALKRGPSDMGSGADDEFTDPRRFKIRKKVLASGLGELWDPGQIPIKLKSKQPDNNSLKAEPKLEDDNTRLANSSADTSDRPKWQSKGWKRAGVEIDPVEIEEQTRSADSLKDEPHSPTPKVEETEVTTNSGAQPGGGTMDANPKSSNLLSAAAKDSDAVKEEEGASSTQPSISAAETSSAPVFKKRRKPQNGAGNREALR